jgi:REP element-mobilizing transposase RayT/predicted house-cleaning noncanonical NTP pyrophosphatase (MazG superfamily)
VTRPLRIEFEDAVYHVMNRGLARQAIFLNDQDREDFLKILQEAHQRWQIQVLGYALMGNHYHLCLQTPWGNLSRVMRHIDGVYTQRFNRSHKRDGPLFRGRYKAIVIDAEEYLGAVVRYIHLNPVKAKIIKDPRDYQWSSHRDYLRSNGKRPWLNTKKLLESMEGPKGFHAYVMEGNDPEIEKYYGRTKQSPVLGGEEFIQWIRERVEEPSKEHVKEERRHFKPKIDEVIECVASAYEMVKAQIEKGVRGQENEARLVAIYLTYQECGLTHQEIAKRFNIGSYGAIGWYCAKAREKMAQAKGLQRRLEEIRQALRRVTGQQKT